MTVETPPHAPQKLNCSLQEPQINIYWPQLNPMLPVRTSRATPTPRPANSSCLTGSLSQSSYNFCGSAGFFDIFIRINLWTLASLWENEGQYFPIELFSWQKFHKNTCMRYKSLDFATKVCQCCQIILNLWKNAWFLPNNTSLAAKGALAHRLQRGTACKIQNGRQGASKW